MGRRVCHRMPPTICMYWWRFVSIAARSGESGAGQCSNDRSQLRLIRLWSVCQRAWPKASQIQLCGLVRLIGSLRNSSASISEAQDRLSMPTVRASIHRTPFLVHESTAKKELRLNRRGWIHFRGPCMRHSHKSKFLCHPSAPRSCADH